MLRAKSLLRALQDKIHRDEWNLILTKSMKSLETDKNEHSQQCQLLKLKVSTVEALLNVDLKPGSANCVAVAMLFHTNYTKLLAAKANANEEPTNCSSLSKLAASTGNTLLIWTELDSWLHKLPCRGKLFRS